MKQMEKAVRIADFKYPKSAGWRCVRIFNHSSCHTCVPEDALVYECLLRWQAEGGYWNSKVQAMNRGGVPKGMKLVLEERGINTRGMTAAQMKIVLRSHDDFENQISKIFLESKGHLAYFFPSSTVNLTLLSVCGPIKAVYKSLFKVHDTQSSSKYSPWFRLGDYR